MTVSYDVLAIVCINLPCVSECVYVCVCVFACVRVYVCMYVCMMYATTFKFNVLAAWQ